MKRARAGEIGTLASALTAHRVWIAGLATDPEAEQGETAEAGALLEAWGMWDVKELRRMYEVTHTKE